jgi:hypothetical protein
VAATSRIAIALRPVVCRLEIAEELVSDVIDDEGRPVAVEDLRDCGCGSVEGYDLPGGEVTCAACLRGEAVRESAAARRRRPHPGRRRRRGEAGVGQARATRA